MYRSHYRRRSSLSPSVVVFLLVASFGILFAGCSPQEPEKNPIEEFTFTVEDMERFRELSRRQETGSGTQPRLVVSDSEGNSASVESTDIDPELARTYANIRQMVDGEQSNMYRVTNAFLNVRSAPKVTSSTVGRLSLGDMVELIEFSDAAWAKIMIGEGEQGYVSTRYIARVLTDEELEEAKKEFAGQYYVDFGFLNVRAEANSQSEKLGELPGQSFVRPLSSDDVWARISYGEGEGYVAAEYLSEFQPNYLVRQTQYNLPILHYRVREEGALAALTQHTTALKDAGYSFMTLRELYSLLLKQEERDARLDPKKVVLALSYIDPENVKQASDTLRTSGAKATFFIESRHLGLGGITEKMVLTLLANGNDLQSAGHTGDDLRSLTNAQVDLELGQSRTLLEKYTKKPVFAVAYPQGGVNDRVEVKAAERGYLLGVATAPDALFTREDFLRLPSIVIDAGMTGEEVLEAIQE